MKNFEVRDCRRRFVLALLLFTWFLWPVSSAQAFHALPLSLEHIEDKNKNLGIEQILAQEGSLPWQPTHAENPRFGYSKSRYWFRFHLPESGLAYSRTEPLFLEIPYIYLSKISLYSAANGKLLRASHAGLAVPQSARDAYVLHAGMPVFRILGSRTPNTEYFISIEGAFPLALPTNLIEGPDFAYHHWTGIFAIGIFLGFFLLAALFNGFLGISLKSRMYFNYSLFVIFLTFLYLGNEGLTVQLLWPDWPWWALVEMHVWGGLAILLYALFVREFLSSKVITPFLDRVLLGLVGISTVRMVWMLFGENQFVAMAGELAVVLCNFLVLMISVFALYKGVKAARYFFMSSLVFNLAVILYIFQEANLIWIGDFLRYSPQFGSAMEVILLSLALADRIRHTNQELADHRAAMILADKLSALGRMAGEVAHEINNPLAIIHANAVLIQEFAAKPQSGTYDLVKLANTIEQTSNRISKVVKGMRVLSRDSRNDSFSSSSLTAILQDSVALCEESFEKKGVKLQICNSYTELSLQCRSSELCQVIVNLLNNSLDALAAVGERWVKLETKIANGFVELAVTDSGTGIPKELRARILEPFFTTKDPGKGLGLGLSISRTIVENHGGKLWLDEASERTRFVFTIPFAEDENIQPA
jgi:signal transduction histidine kinase